MESDLGDPTGPDHMELWHCTRVGWYKAQDSINHALNCKGSQCKKLTLLSSPGRYEGSQSDCILLATNGDIQAINAGSPNVHINLHTVQKVDGGKGKMVGEQPCPIKYHYIK